jgi:hypothetical protein
MAQLATLFKFPRVATYLGTEIGKVGYRIIQGFFSKVDDGSPMVVIFEMQRPMDASFATECLVKIGEDLIKGKFGERALLLSGLPPDAILNLNAAICLRGTQVAFLHVESDGRWQIIGALPDYLQDTLEMVGKKKSLGVGELAYLRDLTTSAASNRLKRLYDMRLVCREMRVTNRLVTYDYHFWQWVKPKT